MDCSKLPALPKGSTYTSQLKKLAEENPDKQAFVFIDKDWNKTVLTRKDLWDKSRKFAAILRGNGIKRGDIVCNSLVASPEKLISILGTLVAGASTMHGQVFLADGEDFFLNCKTSKCKAVVIDPGHSKGAVPILKSFENADQSAGQPKYTGLPDLSTVIPFRACCHNNDDSGSQRGLSSLDNEQEMYEESDTSEDDIAFIFLTSGTTGFSKLVPYSHKSALFCGGILGLIAGSTSEHSIFFNDRSLGWLGGFPGAFLAYGSTRIITDLTKGLPDKPGEHVLRILNEENVDSAIIVPEIEPLMKTIISGKTLKRRLSSFGTGGLPLTKRIFKPLGVLTETINIAYGSTEIGFVTAIHIEAGRGLDFDDYCVGVPFEGYDIKIVDENYQETPAGEIGEVAIRSSKIIPSYLNEPEKTRKLIAEDGFALIGDTAYVDDKGYLYVLGRQADAITKGPFIYYPGWMESRIRKCPGVEHVTVLDVPDPEKHHEICACIIPSVGHTLTEQKLQDFCEKLFMTEVNSDMNAVPKYFLFVDSFPRNANGKQDRK